MKIRCPESNCTVTGLEKSTKYWFSIRPESGNVVGKQSKIINFETSSVICTKSQIYDVSVSNIFAPANAQNTYASLTDMNFATGACGYKEIAATFKTPVRVTSISIAGYFADPTMWSPSNGNGAKIMYHNGTDWIYTGLVAADLGSRVLHTLSLPSPIISNKWKLESSSHLGLSHLIFA